MSLFEWISEKLNSIYSKKEDSQGCSDIEEESGFEICDKNYNKWIRDKFVKEHDHISVKNDSIKNHFWNIDRTSSKEPSWTFALPSAGGQLYVAYSMDMNDKEITMEYPMKNEGRKEIKFTMLLQAGGKMLFRAESSSNRYLVRNQDGLLEMQITDNPTDEMEWMIHYVKPSMGIPSPPSSYTAQIEHGSESKKWKSSGPIDFHHVQQIQTSATENWTVIPSAGHILQFLSGPFFHISQNLLFGSSNNIANFHSTKSGSGVLLQCNNEYVHGPEDHGDLEMKTNKSEATTWELVISNPGFIVGGKTILLSEIPIEESDME
uniref:uncharacterized protein LOC120347693 n=1 Tax=Styela clava TaxID=7725 RepID=UPI001939B20F|nr:uncharacterized protein LOC120347693 [Styela clava]